jgi:hypothetical protein
MILRTNSLLPSSAALAPTATNGVVPLVRRQCLGAATATTSSSDATSLSLRRAADLCLCLAGLDLALNTCCSGLLDNLRALIHRLRGYLDGAVPPNSRFSSANS